jgi:LacI family transcriptional regulator
MASRQITLRDIAAKAGVSVMTVSRALRNHPNLALETRARILQLAERLGYRPNPMVSALMRYRGGGRRTPSELALGFVTNFDTRDGWKKSPLNRDFFKGAAAGAEGHGYHLQEFWLREPRMTAQRLSQVLYARNIPGLLIAPLPVPLGHLRLDWSNFAAVALGYSLAWPPLHRVVDQQFHSMRLALHQLRKLGYRRPGLALRATLDQSAHHHWTAGFLVEQQSRTPAERVPLFVVPDSKWNEAAFQTWFKKHRPDAVLGLDDQLIGWLEDAGLRVPQNVGFVHLNCPDTSGRYAGIFHNGAAVGAAAVDFLVDMIHRNERGIPDLARWLLVEGTWQNGATLRAAAQMERRTKR